MSGIEVYRYELRSRGRLSARSGRVSYAGALIRVNGGYGCIHPWPELGDAVLEEQLRSLHDQAASGAVHGALCCAGTDAVARKFGRSLFEALEIPESHAIVRDAGEVETLLEEGFRCFKVKCGAAPMDDSARLEALVQAGAERLRLDFNESLDAAGFETFWDGLSGQVRERIEFVEDPCRYEGGMWRELHRRKGVAFAIDRGAGRAAAQAEAWTSGLAAAGFHYVVIKPAVDDVDLLASFAEVLGVPVVVTSYMDHPVGQMYAAFEAARLRTANGELVSVCGLMTHVLFEGDPFCGAVRTEGAQLLPPEGTGLGFDELLESLPWEPLT